jgi:hypothetical protein
MACKSCKDKKVKVEGQKEFERRAEFVDKYLAWVILVWFLLGIYGVVSLIQKFL